jgi:hypothetical protein
MGEAGWRAVLRKLDRQTALASSSVQPGLGAPPMVHANSLYHDNPSLFCDLFPYRPQF